MRSSQSIYINIYISMINNKGREGDRERERG